jgi:uncharacterized RDD family membrane protein YckC
MVNGLVSPYPKADLFRRFCAATVDGLVVTTGLLIGARLDSVIAVAAAAAYLLLRDALFVRGQSVGKFFFSLLVVSLETGQPCTWMGSVFRNFFLLIPGLNLVTMALEVVAIVRDRQGQRLGDRLARTQVVEGVGARELLTLVQRELIDEMRQEADERPVSSDVPVEKLSAPGVRYQARGHAPRTHGSPREAGLR